MLVNEMNDIRVKVRCISIKKVDTCGSVGAIGTHTRWTRLCTGLTLLLKP